MRWVPVVVLAVLVIGCPRGPTGPTSPDPSTISDAALVADVRGHAGARPH